MSEHHFRRLMVHYLWCKCKNGDQPNILIMPRPTLNRRETVLCNKATHIANLNWLFNNVASSHNIHMRAGDSGELQSKRESDMKYFKTNFNYV